MAPLLPFALERTLLAILIVGAGLWMGGFVAITIVSATSTKSLGTRERIALFRGLGRSYLRVAAVAFAMVVIPGGVLLAFREWDGYSLAVCVLAGLLVVVTAFAVRQARQLTRMRRAVAQAGTGEEAQTGGEARATGEAQARIATKAAAARVLRTGIGLLSLALFIVAVAMP